MPGYVGVQQVQQGGLPPGYVLANQAGQPLQQQPQQQQAMQLVYGGQSYAVPTGMAINMGGVQQGGVPAAGMAGPGGMTLMSFPGMPGMLAPQQQLAAPQQQQQPVLQQAGQQQQQQVLFSNTPAAQQYLLAPDAGGAPVVSAAPRLGGNVQDPGGAYGGVVTPGNQVYLYTSASM